MQILLIDTYFKILFHLYQRKLSLSLFEYVPENKLLLKLFCLSYKNLWRYNLNILKAPKQYPNLHLNIIIKTAEWHQIKINTNEVCSLNCMVKKYRCKLLANSASTKCCPFQIKINWSKFILDILQKRFYETFLIFLLVASRSLLFGVFLPRKIITIYEKQP